MRFRLRAPAITFFFFLLQRSVKAFPGLFYSLLPLHLSSDIPLFLRLLSSLSFTTIGDTRKHACIRAERERGGRHLRATCPGQEIKNEKKWKKNFIFPSEGPPRACIFIFKCNFGICEKEPRAAFARNSKLWNTLRGGITLHLVGMCVSFSFLSSRCTRLWDPQPRIHACCIAAARAFEINKKVISSLFPKEFELLSVTPVCCRVIFICTLNFNLIRRSGFYKLWALLFIVHFGTLHYQFYRFRIFKFLCF